MFRQMMLEDSDPESEDSLWSLRSQLLRALVISDVSTSILSSCSVFFPFSGVGPKDGSSARDCAFASSPIFVLIWAMSSFTFSETSTHCGGRSGGFLPGWLGAQRGRVPAEREPRQGDGTLWKHGPLSSGQVNCIFFWESLCGTDMTERLEQVGPMGCER